MDGLATQPTTFRVADGEIWIYRLFDVADTSRGELLEIIVILLISHEVAAAILKR